VNAPTRPQTPKVLSKRGLQHNSKAYRMARCRSAKPALNHYDQARQFSFKDVGSKP